VPDDWKDFHCRAQIQPGLCHRGVRVLALIELEFTPTGVRERVCAGVRATMSCEKIEHAAENLAAAPAAAVRSHLFRRHYAGAIKAHVQSEVWMPTRSEHSREAGAHFDPRSQRLHEEHIFVGRLALYRSAYYRVPRPEPEPERCCAGRLLETPKLPAVKRRPD